MKFDFMHPAEQLVLILNRIYAKQMTTTSGGNLSILDSEGNIWITPSGIDKGSLTEADICKVLPDGTVIGKHKPSVELPFHKLVYQTRKDVKSVVHAHPPALVSFSLVRSVPDVNIIPSPHQICGPVGMAAYEVPGSIKLGENIAEEFQKGYNVVVMDNHGVVTCGKTLLQAFERFETLEYAAKLNIVSSTLGEVYPLSQKELENSEQIAPALAEVVAKDHSADECRLRKEMCKLIHRAYDQNLFTSTQGNFSVRLTKDSFLITPYGVDRKYLSPEDIVRIDGSNREAGKVPSRSVLMHKQIYDKHPEVNAVTVAHPVHLMCFGITRTTLDSRTIPESYIMMRDIVRVPFATPYKAPQTIAESLSERTPVVMVENDSVIAIGNTLIKAFDRLEVAEFTANTIIHAKQIGNIVPITKSQVEEINLAFHLE